MAGHVERVGLRELRLDTRAVVERAARGPIEITDRGVVVALLSPADGSPSPRRAPRIDRALRLLDERPRVDTGALDELMADKRADIEMVHEVGADTTRAEPAASDRAASDRAASDRAASGES